MTEDYNEPSYKWWTSVGAKYTITIADLVQNHFDFGLTEKDYPIWDEDWRDYLNSLILNHFYMREIGCETEGQFKIRLNAKMREIMPYYNIKFDAMLGYDFNPLIDHDYAEDYSDTFTQTSTDDKNMNDDYNKDTDRHITDDTVRGEDITQNDVYHETYSYTDWKLHSDTPQNELTTLGLYNDEQLVEMWLTDAEKDYGQHTKDTTNNMTRREDETTNEVNQMNQNENSTDHNYGRMSDYQNDTAKKYWQHNAGRKDSAQNLLKDYMDLAEPLFTQLLNELEPLFMRLY